MRGSIPKSIKQSGFVYTSESDQQWPDILVNSIYNIKLDFVMKQDQVNLVTLSRVRKL